MLYTISSRGRPIGVTDLGFMRLGGVNRSGYFHPNEEGEHLMPSVAAPLPAMRAFMIRDVMDDRGRSIVRPEMFGSALFADLAEALHRAADFELALHREDGSLVPTEIVGIQDTEEFRHLVGVEIVEVINDGEDDEGDDNAWCDDEEAAEAALHELFAAEHAGEVVTREEWVPEDIVPPAPRYQVHVRLLDAAALP